MWVLPHPIRAGHTLVLLDTEGLGDVEKGDQKNDAWIFSLAILLSSTLVYNSRGTIDNQAVENLQYVTELTERIKVKSSSGDSASEDDDDGAEAQFVQFFPKFVWAVRDFTLELKIDGRDVNDNQYLEHALSLRKGRDRRTADYNLPRECIRNYFPSRRCFVFRTPASPDHMSRLESLNEGDLCPSFLAVTTNFCKYIFENSSVKTVKGGLPVTGRMLGHLAKSYVDTIARGDVPCLENAVLTMAKIENEAAGRVALKEYQEHMQELCFPVDLEAMSRQHRLCDTLATKTFMSRSFKDDGGEHLKDLAEAIAKHYADLLCQNEEASEALCRKLLSELSAPMAKKMQEGFYIRPGGYELYCADNDSVVAQFRSKPNKGVRVEEVLEQFLKEKSVESNFILLADKKFSEQEKDSRVVKAVMASRVTVMESPLCLIENTGGNLCVNPEAVDILMGINQPVVVVAVVGLYRTGKSYLMNKLAGKKHGETRGFTLGATVQSKTKGIWMWVLPHPIRAGHTLVLLDTEGLGDVEKRDQKNDAWIFSLAILLSSTLVYNSRGTIDNQAVENLQYVTELTERIKVKSSSGDSASEDDDDGAEAQFVQFFPKFVWAVRDFTLELKIDGRDVNDNQYLEHALSLRKDHMSRLESLNEGDLCPSFLAVTTNFCKYIFENSSVKTVKGGLPVTGRMLGHLAKSYVDTIARGDMPCLENAVLTMAKIENEAAGRDALKEYQKGMQELCFPVDLEAMSRQHRLCDTLATKTFMSRSFKDDGGEHLKDLVEAIAKHYADLLCQNEEASEALCRKLLSELSAPMAKKMQEGFYIRPGGYELYCADSDSVVAQFRSKPNKGVRAEEVLGQFLGEKSVESNSILQADIKLSEQERKILELRSGDRASRGGAATPAAGPSGTTGGKSGTTGERHFIDVHRTALTDRVYSVTAILDRLLERRVITQLGYNDIMAESTNNRMRKIFSGPIHSGGKRAKDVLYEILEEQEPYLMDELKEL
ncbi:hypothetical protein SKAU_G00417140 [Synaphobranchus kaupii]|uniref:Uncharacterized protein n=1 Tax=Synaphobranchus kaupii TaxID=118154 RepID=A0A9Q1I8W5_SYNKA|nr:hypothetical protein SKAU_G00417140 [Synaphobranchus kaupii]